MDEKVRYWLEGSDYDLGTAEAMLRTGRYLYVGFMCHQAIEKVLKATYQAGTGQVPPRTHNLRLLLQESGLEAALEPEQRSLILELDPLNVEARYPESRERLQRLLSEERCSELLARTRELQKWIRERL
ncbi:MAG: HEPN domain-containing protein [Deltaproteobacteria bacterium]|nr:HEPN domain-containing protein [Deltaproteobacteria bacterium]